MIYIRAARILWSYRSSQTITGTGRLLALGGLKEKEPSPILEAWIIRVHRILDGPSVGDGGPTLGAATLPMKTDTLQKVRKAVTLEKTPKSKFGLLKADRISGARV